MAILIDGKAIAADVRAQAAQRVQALKEKGIEPALAVILAGEDPASKVYVRNKARACKECGIRSEVIRLGFFLPKIRVFRKFIIYKSKKAC